MGSGATPKRRQWSALLVCGQLAACATPSDPSTVSSIQPDKVKPTAERAVHAAHEATRPSIKPQPATAAQSPRNPASTAKLERDRGEPRPAKPEVVSAPPAASLAPASQTGPAPREQKPIVRPETPSTAVSKPESTVASGGATTAQVPDLRPEVAPSASPQSPANPAPLPPSASADTVGTIASRQPAHDATPAGTAPSLCNIGLSSAAGAVSIEPQPCPVDLRPSLKPGEPLH